MDRALRWSLALDGLNGANAKPAPTVPVPVVECVVSVVVSQTEVHVIRVRPLEKYATRQGAS
ncbi:MAG: hypothetical protein LC808_25885 [Actinobacteria bacterium]|nr:hypothetical protein [Actinomycetota bacterium]